LAVALEQNTASVAAFRLYPSVTAGWLVWGDEELRKADSESIGKHESAISVRGISSPSRWRIRFSSRFLVRK
jgi:hypothetical protein